MLKNAALMHAQLQLQLQSTYKRAEVAKKKKTKRRRRRLLKRQTASAATNDLHTTRAEIMIKVMCYVRVCVYVCVLTLGCDALMRMRFVP